jgi:two-component sensor histidine kinase
VSPKVRSRAPLSWAIAPGRAAHAHRRLRRATASARALVVNAPRQTGGVEVPADVASCVSDLEKYAATVDDRLVLATRCSPIVRRNLLRALDGEVKEIEQLSARIGSLVLRTQQGVASIETVRRISDRLDALDAAHAELAALEAAWSTPSYSRPLPGPAERPGL